MPLDARASAGYNQRMGKLSVTTRPIDELGAWLVLCDALGINVDNRGCGEYVLTVPPGVIAPDPPRP